MNNHLEEKIEKKYQRHERKKRKRMKVSGKKVLELRRLIIKKAKGG